MNTSRLISNISYNSLDYFEYKITELVENNVIDYCYWIKHYPDDDDKKEHIHLVLKPSERIDTTKLRLQFNELDTTNIKPLSVTSVWRFCNSMDDWILYAIHDKQYLKSKHLERKHHYKYNNIRSTDYDALNADINMIDRTRFDRLFQLEEYAKNKIPFYLLVQDGIIPINLRASYEAQYDALRSRYHE